METFAAIAITLYVAHHVGDYWIQTDHQACHKGAGGAEGRIACLKHVATYTLTQLGYLRYREELGTLARRTVAADFTWRACGEATVAAYEAALR